MTTDVFISYSSKDKHAADAACVALERRKIRCWIAPRDIVPGTPWGASIIEAIESVKVMILVVSVNANGSPQIEREVERAVHRGVPVIPFRIEDIKPTKSLEYFISASHWLDAFTPPVEQHLDRLTDVVRALLAKIDASAKIDAAATREKSDELFEISEGSGAGTVVPLASPWEKVRSLPQGQFSRGNRNAIALTCLGLIGVAAAIGTWLALRKPIPAATQAAQVTVKQVTSRPLVPEDVPFVRDIERAIIRRQYLNAPDHKALAISYTRAGFISGQRDDEQASTSAITACQKASATAGPGYACEVYAVGNKVVYKPGLPPTPPDPWVTDDPSVSQPFVPARLPLLQSTNDGDMAKYEAASTAKALALSPGGGSAWRYGNASQKEAIRRTLEVCGAATGFACTIVAVDNRYVVPVPTSMKPIGLFRAAEDVAIAPELRGNVTRRLANDPGGWSAVSVGAAGIPGVATKIDTEIAAVTLAQADCLKADRGCRVIAIGPFTVAPLSSNTKRP